MSKRTTRPRSMGVNIGKQISPKLAAKYWEQYSRELAFLLPLAIGAQGGQGPKTGCNVGSNL
jgi:hypothetical protein